MLAFLCQPLFTLTLKRMQQDLLWLRASKVNTLSHLAPVNGPAGSFIQRTNGVSVAGKSLAAYLGIMGGPVGTKVRLELVNPERKETNTVALVRQKFLTLN